MNQFHISNKLPAEASRNRQNFYKKRIDYSPHRHAGNRLGVYENTLSRKKLKEGAKITKADATFQYEATITGKEVIFDVN
jgi:hypothetical protein